ncbi:MAG: hypothetical protein FWB85_09490 [Chitinispirillia bacterium]|nr:hypothetical protein [Chitinispirillia bacterium]
MTQMEINPYHKSLRTKKLHGTPGLKESSVNMDIRIIWYLENNKIIFTSDVGHHDVLKKY